MNYLITVIATLLAITQLFQSNAEKFVRILTITMLLAVAILSILNEVNHNKQEKYTKSAGTVPMGLDKNIEEVCLKINDRFSITKFPDVMYGETRVFEGFKIWIENNELKVSAVIRDESGEIITTLKANEWQVNPDKVLDKNFDNNAIEVIDKKGDVILQANFIGYEILSDGKKWATVEFKGIFTQKNGWRFALGDFSNKVDEGIAFTKIIPPKLEDETIKFEKIFMYPSELHPGERK